MAKDEKKEGVEVAEVAPVKKVEHKNIYEALAAFQGENPKIERTKQVKVKMKSGETYDFWYAPLDEVLQTVRPLLAKHGLSFVHVNAGEETVSDNARMQCVLFHETYYRHEAGEHKTVSGTTEDNLTTTTYPIFEETGVIRSMPITVKRTGDMKDVGGDSTYARRYTLAEVLGIAPDEDNDAPREQERTERLESFAFKKAKESVSGAKDGKILAQQVEFFEAELKALSEGKPSSLGLTEPQYQELMKLAVTRRTELGKDAVGKGAPGENKDGNGQATIGA